MSHYGAICIIHDSSVLWICEKYLLFPVAFKTWYICDIMNYLFHYSYQYLTFILINFPGHQRRRRVISERSLSKLFTRMPMKLCKTLKKGKTINCKFRIEEGHMLRFTGNAYQYTCQWDGLRSRVLSLQTKSPRHWTTESQLVQKDNRKRMYLAPTLCPQLFQDLGAVLAGKTNGQLGRNCLLRQSESTPDSCLPANSSFSLFPHHSQEEGRWR